MVKDASNLVLIAQIGAPQGIKGELRLKSFSDDPLGIGNYGSLCDASGSRWFELTSLRSSKNKLIAKFSNINDRNQAGELTGTKLFVPKDRLPDPEEGEFYHVDLVGLDVIGIDGTRIGKVIAVADFGAGDLLEVSQEKRESVYIPFTKQIVPDVNLDTGQITVDLPEGLQP